MCPRVALIISLSLFLSPLYSNTNGLEQFDISGLPKQPTNFEEQQIFELLKGYHSGDKEGAETIQKKLYAYYNNKGDQKRAEEVNRRLQENRHEPAAISQPVPTSQPSKTNQSTQKAETGLSPPRKRGSRFPRDLDSRLRGNDGTQSEFSGNFFGKNGNVLHTWDFNPDGTFYHTTIVGGSGTSVRNGERGTFQTSGSTMILRVQKTVSAYATPGSGNTTLLGGNTEEKTETRQLSFKNLKKTKGIILNGLELKPKSW